MTSKLTATSITVTQGDTLPILLTFNQDITRAVIAMQVRDENNQVVIDKTVTEHLNPEKGETLLTLTPQDTSIPVGTYQTDMEITFADGSNYTFYPPQIGQSACFHITKQITQGASWVALH